MTNYNKLFVPAAIYIAVLTHIVILFRPFKVAPPEKLQEPEPAFQYIEAVMVEVPQPEPPIVEEPEIVEAPPVPEPEPPAPIEEEPEIVEEAVEIGEESEEVDVPEPVEPTVIEEFEPKDEYSPKQSAAAEPESEASVPAAPEPEEKVFLPFYRVEKRPAFLYKAPLQYPIQAKRQRIEGVVIVEVDIDENGSIFALRVAKEEGFGLDEAAIDMLRQSRFSPAIIDGRPVAVRMRFTIEFKLN